ELRRRLFFDRRARQLGNLLFQPANVLSLGVAAGDRRDAELAHRVGVICPALAQGARQSDIGRRVVAEERIPRQGPDVALLLAGGDGVARTEPFFGPVAVRQTLDQVGQLVADGLVAELSNSETNRQPGESALAIAYGRAAQMLAGQADGDRGLRKLGKMLQG